MLYQTFNPIEHSLLVYKHRNICILFTNSIVSISHNSQKDTLLPSSLSLCLIMVFRVRYGLNFQLLFRWTNNFESPTSHHGHPGPMSGQSTKDLWWRVAAEKFFSLIFPSQYDSTYAWYTSSSICCSYWQDKWTKSGNLPKKKAFSENREHLI